MRNVVKWIIIVSIIFYSLGTIPALEAGTASGYIDVDIYTWDDGTPDDPFDSPVPEDEPGITFPGFDDATRENPWLISPQFLLVTYDCTSDDPEDPINWGIRIVTDNETNIGQVYPQPLNSGPGGRWHWEEDTWPEDRYHYVEGHWEGERWINPYWETGNDSVSFGGMIDRATKNNLNLRASLAWQVYEDPVPAPDDIYEHPIYGWNVGSNPVEWRPDVWLYPYAWAYIVDRSDKWNGESSIGAIFYPSPPAPEWSVRYEIVVQGDDYVNFLSQYPPMQISNPDIRPGDTRPGECTVAIYLATHFGISCVGDYGTTIYLELIYE